MAEQPLVAQNTAGKEDKSMLSNITKHSIFKDENKFSDRKKRIFTFLRENPVGVLSSVTPDGNPHGAVVYFRVDKDFTISILTKTGTRKYDNIKHNNHTMLTVFEPETQATVQVTGLAEEVLDNYEVNGIAGTILGISMKTSESGTPPISKLDAGMYTAFKITPLQARMAVYARPDPGGYGEIFESVESFELSEDY